MDSASTDDAKSPKSIFDPETFRMSIGDHLDELRKRVLLGLIGFVVACLFWFAMGEKAINVFVRPLQIAQDRAHVSQNMFYTEISEPFMTYMRVSILLGVATASPWLLYQMWLFVAAGLYPKERKYITKYLPLSITLMIAGMLFLYFYVLPLMLQFFLIFHFGDTIAVPHPPPTHATTQPLVVPFILGDPAAPASGQIWFDTQRSQLKIAIAPDDVRVMTLGSGGLTSPLITISTYIDMVIGMLISFGLAFQMPLVVLALTKIGIVEIAALRKFRRIVYFLMSIVAAVIVPDVTVGMFALLVPLILLYEFGILLAVWSEKNALKEDSGL